MIIVKCHIFLLNLIIVKKWLDNKLTFNMFQGLSLICRTFSYLAALDVMEQWKESGPIQPKHIREAVRRMKQNGGIPNMKYKNRLF